jgi:putative ABC transport system substrate-binding protein
MMQFGFTLPGSVLIALVIIVPVQLSFAQQTVKVPRLGYLRSGANSDLPAREGSRQEAFRQGLRDLGYVEGKNIAIDYRTVGLRLERLPDLARELVNLKVDVIVAVATPAVEAAKNATNAIPIVMSGGDPVRSGFAASLARPGGNITGLSNLTSELAGKRLELLKEIVPRLSRVAVLWTPNLSLSLSRLREIELAAQSLGVEPHAVEVRGPDDLEPAFLVMKRQRVGALVTLRGSVIASRERQIVELAANHRLPAMYDNRSFVNFGGLMSYGTNLSDLDRRAAFYVDRILKGAKPADLPVEQPTKFELVINLKTARQIGLTIPLDVLRWADEVIK